MRRPSFTFAVLAVACLAAAGCGLHRPPPTPRPAVELEKLAAERWAEAATRKVIRTPGSLWQQDGLGDLLIRDTRAARMDDLVTVLIVEATEGSNSADADLTRNSTNEWGVPQLFGLDAKLDGKSTKNFALADLFRTNTQKAFAGGGATSRTSSLMTTVTTRVFQVFPNGNLAILGRKEVTINNEHQTLWLAGLVRPEDIEADNSVRSTRIAELSLFLAGAGDVNDNLREGWLSRWLTRAWPF